MRIDLSHLMTLIAACAAALLCPACGSRRNSPLPSKPAAAKRAADLPDESSASKQENATRHRFVGTIRVGHLVGICMSPLFLADAKNYFATEGLDVDLVFMSNPGDSISALTGGSVHFIHNPFTNTYVAASNGAPLTIVSGSGNGGLVCIAQRETGIRTVQDLKARARTGLRLGSERINTLELTLYRTLKNQQLAYDDFDMVWFTDHFAMLSAFQTGAVDVVTHVEPYATQLIQEAGGIPLSTSADVWGADAPDCVVTVRADFLREYPDTVRRYLRALYRADRFIKSDLTKAVTLLDEGKYYRVNAAVLTEALPRQPPGVDLRKGLHGMETAISDMVDLKYLKSKPQGLVDLTLLTEVVEHYQSSHK